MAIRCGKNHGYHATRDDVRRCYQGFDVPLVVESAEGYADPGISERQLKWIDDLVKERGLSSIKDLHAYGRREASTAIDVLKAMKINRMDEYSDQDLQVWGFRRETGPFKDRRPTDFWTVNDAAGTRLTVVKAKTSADAREIADRIPSVQLIRQRDKGYNLRRLYADELDNSIFNPTFGGPLQKEQAPPPLAHVREATSPGAPASSAPRREPTPKQLDWAKVLLRKQRAVFKPGLESLTRKEIGKVIDLLQSGNWRRDVRFAPQVELEDGFYKIGNGQIGDSDVTIYKVLVAVHGNGHKYAKRLDIQEPAVWTDDCDLIQPAKTRWVKEDGVVFRLTPEQRLSEEDQKRFGQIYGRCMDCGRPLTDEVSIREGIGPVCGRRV